MGRHRDHPTGLWARIDALGANPRRIGVGYWPTSRQSWGDRLGDIAMFWVVPLIGALFLLPIAARDLGPSWSAAHGGGVHGLLHVTSEDCSGRGPSCQPLGRFAADDGSVVIDEVRFSTGSFRRLSVGDDVRVTYQGERHPPLVYVEDRSWDWIFVVAFVVLGVLCALWCLMCALLGAARIAWHLRRGEP